MVKQNKIQLLTLKKSARSEVTCLWTYRRDEGAHPVLFQLKYIASLLSVPNQMHDV